MSDLSPYQNDSGGVELRLPATRASLRLARSFAESFLLDRVSELPADRREEVLLAMQEACSNVVRHAYCHQAEPGELGLRINLVRGHLCLAVIDEGKGFDPTLLPSPDFEQPCEGGMGVYLIRQVMSKVTYQRRGSKNVLLMECPLIVQAGE